MSTMAVHFRSASSSAFCCRRSWSPNTIFYNRYCDSKQTCRSLHACSLILKTPREIRRTCNVQPRCPQQHEHLAADAETNNLFPSFFGLRGTPNLIVVNSQENSSNEVVPVTTPKCLYKTGRYSEVLTSHSGTLQYSTYCNPLPALYSYLHQTQHSLLLYSTVLPRLLSGVHHSDDRTTSTECSTV